MSCSNIQFPFLTSFWFSSPLLCITVLKTDLQGHWTFMLRQLPQQRNTEITQGLVGVISHVALWCCPKKEASKFFSLVLHPDRILHIFRLYAVDTNWLLQLQIRNTETWRYMESDSTLSSCFLYRTKMYKTEFFEISLSTSSSPILLYLLLTDSWPSSSFLFFFF